MSAPLPEIQETPERMIFLVRSDTNPRLAYRVDLLANDGAGHCVCMDFATRRQKNIDAGVKIWTKATTCRHTLKAAWHVIRQTFPVMAEQDDRERRR